MNLALVLLDSNLIRSKVKRLRLGSPKFEPRTSRGGFKLVLNHQTITFVMIISIYFLILVLNSSPPSHFIFNTLWLLNFKNVSPQAPSSLSLFILNPDTL
jgi:hypothetical protein